MFIAHAAKFCETGEMCDEESRNSPIKQLVELIDKYTIDTIVDISVVGASGVAVME